MGHLLRSAGGLPGAQQTIQRREVGPHDLQTRLEIEVRGEVRADLEELGHREERAEDPVRLRSETRHVERLSAGEHEFVETALDAVWPALATLRAGGIDIAGAEWGMLAPALQQAALRRAHARLAPGATLGLQHVEQARAIIGRGVGGQLDLPGGVGLQVGYGGSFALGAAPVPDGPQLAAASMVLPEHGTVALGSGWALQVSREPVPAPAGRT